MKRIFIIVLFLSIYSCLNKDNESRLKGYYYDINSSNIYSFKNSKLIIYHIYDSLYSNDKYTISKENITINDESFSFEKRNDTLFLYNFPKRERDLALVQFEFKNPNLKEIHLSSWTHTFLKTSRNNQAKFLEEQILKIDLEGGMDAYYTKQRDTLYGDYFKYEGKVFDKFILFKKQYITLVITSSENNILNILTCYGDKTNLESFNRVIDGVSPPNFNVIYDGGD